MCTILCYTWTICLLLTVVLTLEQRTSAQDEGLKLGDAGNEFWKIYGFKNVPESIDWRTLNVITDVFDERRFFSGYSWAFAAVGTVESQVLMRNIQQFSSLSAQSLIDCIPFGNETELTNLSFVYNYLLSKGVLPEKNYPYKPGKDKCDRKADETANKIVIDFYMGVVDENHLKSVVGTMGPVSALIDASNLEKYSSGIVTNKLCGNTEEDLNQAVLVVGYGTENGKDYWIVKNSWGPHWGEKGYLRIARNSNNTCGIALRSLYAGIFNKTISSL